MVGANSDPPSIQSGRPSVSPGDMVDRGCISVAGLKPRLLSKDMRELKRGKEFQDERTSKLNHAVDGGCAGSRMFLPDTCVGPKHEGKPGCSAKGTG